MFAVNILKKVLDYSFMYRTKIKFTYLKLSGYIKDEIKAIFYHSKDFRLRLWDTNYTNYINVLKYKDFSSVVLPTIIPR